MTVDTILSGDGINAAESAANAATNAPVNAPEGAPGEGGGGGDWVAALPEGLREIATRAGSMDNLRSALERGVSHVPITSADAIEISAPEGFEVNEDGAAWFKELAVAEGFTQKQASALIDGYNAKIAAGAARQKEVAHRNLQALYGEDFTAKMAVAEDGAKKLNELSNGALGKVLQMGLGNHEDFIKAMVVIGESISNSVIPGFSQGGGANEAMSTAGFIEEIFNKGKE